MWVYHLPEQLVSRVCCLVICNFESKKIYQDKLSVASKRISRQASKRCHVPPRLSNPDLGAAGLVQTLLEEL